MQRPTGSNRFDSQNTVKTVQHPDSVMVWACFSGSVGHGCLSFLPKNITMHGERYQQVLEDHVRPLMAVHKSTHFLQDGAPFQA
jgi:hypothetical protein